MEVFTIQKYPCVNGATQFKPVLFKGQLYLVLRISLSFALDTSHIF